MKVRKKLAFLICMVALMKQKRMRVSIKSVILLLLVVVVVT